MAFGSGIIPGLLCNTSGTEDPWDDSWGFGPPSLTRCMRTAASKPSQWPLQRPELLEETSQKLRRGFSGESCFSTVRTLPDMIVTALIICVVLSIFMVTLLVPSNDKDLLQSSGTAAESPFVIAAQRAGIKAVPSVINFVVLTSAWSAGNSGQSPNLRKRILN